MKKRPLNIIIAGGGTGGHLFPGIAIAQSFVESSSSTKILFVNAGRPVDRSVLSKTDFDFKNITVQGIKGRGFLQKARTILMIPRSIIESMRIIRGFKPDLVVGVGGYSSGPVVISAWIFGIKTVLQEQNILPGITNRILSSFVSRIYVSFEESLERFRRKKSLVTGNPVRKEILQCAAGKNHGDDADSDIKPFTVMILGGSQGAHSINMTMVDALKHIEEKDKYHFVHQTGTLDEEAVKNVYAIHAVSALVQAFFNDMPQQYEKADLIICRAGATTVAEITAIGRCVIFIPFPFAADNHQVLNAQALVQADAAEMILEKDLNAEILAQRIGYYRLNTKALKEMTEKSKQFGRPEAAEVIVEDCYNIMDRKGVLRQEAQSL